MDRIDKEIMMALLHSQRSMYGLEKSLEDTNYATVYRHIKRMQKEGLLSATGALRKNGKNDERGTQKPELTFKGLATLIIEGELQKEQLQRAAMKALQSDFGVSIQLLLGTRIDEIFASTLLKIRPKLNLKCFDGQYFNQVFNTSLLESIFEQAGKIHFENDSRIKVEAQRLKEKYVGTKQPEAFREIRQFFTQEIEKYNRYVKIIDDFLKVIGN
jgi:hypothetical protein